MVPCAWHLLSSPSQSEHSTVG